MRIVVFGGSGFLGSHVAEALSEASYAVTVFDRIESPYLRNDQNMITGDILDFDSVKMAVSGSDAVYHFAGIADLGAADACPLETGKVNVIGTLNILEACRQHGVRRFVFASTMYVYSKYGGFYRASKQSAERFIEIYSEVFGMHHTILRYGSLYGRRADQNNRIGKMIRDAVQEKKIFIEGTAEDCREFIHVRDAARLSVRSLSEKYINCNLVVTGQESLKVSQLAEMIQEILPYKVEIVFQGMSTESTNHYRTTPYAFNPNFGYKMVPNEYIDLGQGLLDCIQAEVENKEEQ